MFTTRVLLDNSWYIHKMENYVSVKNNATTLYIEIEFFKIYIFK